MIGEFEKLKFEAKFVKIDWVKNQLKIYILKFLVGFTLNTSCHYGYYVPVDGNKLKQNFQGKQT